MKRVWCFIRASAKAIAAGIGALVAVVASHIGSPLAAGVEAGIILFVIGAITYIIPNTDCPKA